MTVFICIDPFQSKERDAAGAAPGTEQTRRGDVTRYSDSRTSRCSRLQVPVDPSQFNVAALPKSANILLEATERSIEEMYRLLLASIQVRSVIGLDVRSLKFDELLFFLDDGGDGRRGEVLR